MLSSCPSLPAQVTFVPMKWDTLTTSLPINQSHLLLALEQVCQWESTGVGNLELLAGCPRERTQLA